MQHRRPLDSGKGIFPLDLAGRFIDGTRDLGTIRPGGFHGRDDSTLPIAANRSFKEPSNCHNNPAMIVTGIE